MKLVDLLVKEWEEWPKNVTYFVQDSDGEVKAGLGSKLSEPTGSCVWIRHICLDNYNFYSGLCTDWQTSVVTKDIYTKHKEETQMKQDFRNTKIRIKSEEHSKAIQEAVFAAGGKWRHSGQLYREGVNFIFLNDSLGMTLCDNAVFFQEHDYKEIQFPLPTKDAHTKHNGRQMKRKVRKDFDPAKEYSVDVSCCTVDEKKEIQQAFFDVGIEWNSNGENYQFLCALQYSNAYEDGEVTSKILHSGEVNGCNMTAKEFLELVYEPEKQGHVHAELMAQYADDAETTDKPWKLWEYSTPNFRGYKTCFEPITFLECNMYRRKPKTKLIHGVEIPVFEFTPKVGEKYYVANVGLPEFFEQWRRQSEDCTFTQRMLERGLLYPYTEEGKKAAILHSKAMLGGVA